MTRSSSTMVASLRSRRSPPCRPSTRIPRTSRLLLLSQPARPGLSFTIIMLLSLHKPPPCSCFLGFLSWVNFDLQESHPPPLLSSNSQKASAKAAPTHGITSPFPVILTPQEVQEAQLKFQQYDRVRTEFVVILRLLLMTREPPPEPLFRIAAEPSPTMS